ncbi:hypothetical protein HX799_21430 [Pseudomonas tolaasii]|uniref:hypothetical protein n=1 Tax=Pseudomonas tolaasii TaxID=29442 RepID=UPI0015B83C36|nr:hypothetical protein [Pseudomonas tolaasii]NWC53731.1 hypothetical protein [Pseudomonas tolaasii]NWE64756.1 hypothetical protein [Pseudomonas tolaasii]
MRCCSMTNDRGRVRQPLGISKPAREAEYKPQRNDSIRDIHYSPTLERAKSDVKGYSARNGVVGAISKLGSLLATLFNRFASALTGGEFRETVKTFPEPELQPSNPPAGFIPGLSMKRHGAKANDIWGGFRQGSAGNCVTVSAIKAAMHRFGQSPTDICKEVTKIAGGYRVVMRDDFMLTLTEQELMQGVRGAQFVGVDAGMLKDAHFLYAASAKRAQMENNDGTAECCFAAARNSLNDKEDEWGPGEGLKRLGLSEHMRTVSAQDLARGQLGICNRRGHSVAVINGREELWGRRGGVPFHGDAIALL